MIAVMGESGAGKTTSARTLDPKNTYYIDCDKKGLAWKGWRNQYNTENKTFIPGRDLQRRINANQRDQRCAHCFAIVIDTLNTCMVDKEVKSMNDKGYDKWIDLTQYVWEVCETASQLRDDMTVVIMFHSETIRDDLGYTFTRIKTNGRKLEKVVLESLFSTVLLANRNGNGEYIFEVKAKNSTAKTPLEHLKQRKYRTILTRYWKR